MLAMALDTEGRVVMNGRLDASQAAAAQAFLDARSGTVVLGIHIAAPGLAVLPMIRSAKMYVPAALTLTFLTVMPGWLLTKRAPLNPAPRINNRSELLSLPME